MNINLPIFELHDVNNKTSFKIYADGRTEGFPPVGVIINRIPQFVYDSIQEYNKHKDN